MPNDILSRARVLIIDDEVSNVRLLERILEMFGGTNVRSTTDSREALGLCLEFEPDLILLDLHMPFLDGFAVMEQIKAITPAGTYLPVLVLTADITVETKRRALTMGARDLVNKPLDHSEVILRIKNLLENRFLHQQLQEQNERLEQQVQERTAQVEETLNQLRSTQDQIIKQERLRALGMMAGGIAHDFNNALTMMLGYGELLMPYLEQASAKEAMYLQHMISAAQDATHVVARLREFYRPMTGHDVRVPLSLNAIVEQAVSLTAPKWSNKSLADGVQIAVRADLETSPSVLGNGAELREVLTNLIFNAVDAMPAGGSITVRTRVSDGGVCLSVTDTGIGMTPEEKERCLEPFFTTKGEYGTGLGLAMVYGIVQRHEGRIDVESEKGVGTTFSIWIPATESEVVVTNLEPAKLDRALHIMVVDDQEIICELIAEYLQSDGHTTTMVTHAPDAMACCAGAEFDLLVTDQSMPGMNGVQLAGLMKAHDPGVRTILLTGFGEEMQAMGECPANIDLVLGKPVTAANLRSAVFSVMAMSERVDAAGAQAMAV